MNSRRDKAFVLFQTWWIKLKRCIKSASPLLFFYQVSFPSTSGYVKLIKIPWVELTNACCVLLRVYFANVSKLSLIFYTVFFDRRRWCYGNKLYVASGVTDNLIFTCSFQLDLAPLKTRWSACFIKEKAKNANGCHVVNLVFSALLFSTSLQCLGSLFVCLPVLLLLSFLSPFFASRKRLFITFRLVSTRLDLQTNKKQTFTMLENKLLIALYSKLVKVPFRNVT